MSIETDVIYLVGLAGLAIMGYLIFPYLKRRKDTISRVGRVKKEKKAKEQLKEIEVAAQPSPDAPSVIPPPPPSNDVMEQFPVPQTIQIELTRIKEGSNKRAIMRKGRVTLVPRFGGGKDLFFFYFGKMGYFIDPSKIIKVKDSRGRVIQKLVYDIFAQEPLDEKGNLTWSPQIELLWRDSILDQYITVATFEGGFQLTPQLKQALIVVGVLGLLLGIALNGIGHLTPTTEIHWVP